MYKLFSDGVVGVRAVSAAEGICKDQGLSRVVADRDLELLEGSCEPDLPGTGRQHRVPGSNVIGRDHNFSVSEMRLPPH